MTDPEISAFVSVDVETAGPSPSEYALLAIGACLVVNPEESFYVEIRPDRQASTPEAFAVHGLSLDRLAVEGLPPDEALTNFAAWLKKAVPKDRKPIFVAFNAPFDWMFVSDYFHRYLGYNPFGHAALDIKAYYMGLHGVDWIATSMPKVFARYQYDQMLSHNALLDARDQAKIFRYMLPKNKT
jgi:DNA polymerase III epsilon subunit-like protein